MYMKAAPTLVSHPYKHVAVAVAVAVAAVAIVNVAADVVAAVAVAVVAAEVVEDKGIGDRAEQPWEGGRGKGYRLAVLAYKELLGDLLGAPSQASYDGRRFSSQVGSSQ